MGDILLSLFFIPGLSRHIYVVPGIADDFIPPCCPVSCVDFFFVPGLSRHLGVVGIADDLIPPCGPICCVVFFIPGLSRHLGSAV